MPQQDLSQEEIFSRRAVLLGGAQVALLAGLLGRLGWLQLVQSSHYQKLSERNRTQVDLLPPARGRIFDRNGEELARNLSKYNLYIMLDRVRDFEALLASLSEITPLTKEVVEEMRENLLTSRRFIPFAARRDLSWAEVTRIEARAADLQGVKINLSDQRIYPFRNTLAHIVGYVSRPSEREIKKHPLYYLPGFVVGKSGVEKGYEESLRGLGGETRYEVNAKGQKVSEVARISPQHGRELWLSIDARLQNMITKKLAGEKRAAAVVLDIHTGEVVAGVSVPSFDPNLFAQGIDRASWQSISTNPHYPLTNKIVSGAYAPGSIFKAAVMLAALEKGFPISTRHICHGRIKHGNRWFHCWRRGGHGSVAMIDAIRESCDVWFYKVALALGISNINKYAQLLGYGHKLNLDLPDERAGLLPSKAWKLRKIGQPWLISDTLLSAIGQGYVLATPMQMAVQMARIANGGFAVEPRVTFLPDSRKRLFADGKSPFRPLGVEKSSLKLLRAGLDEVVNHPAGTAYKARIHVPARAMAGKTGTAQVRRISIKERKSGILHNLELPWLKRDHAMFAGFAPVSDPQWAAAIVVEHGGSGSSAAAPYIRDFLDYTQKIIKPSYQRPKIETAESLG